MTDPSPQKWMCETNRKCPNPGGCADAGECQYHEGDEGQLWTNPQSGAALTQEMRTIVERVAAQDWRLGGTYVVDDEEASAFRALLADYDALRTPITDGEVEGALIGLEDYEPGDPLNLDAYHSLIERLVLERDAQSRRIAELAEPGKVGALVNWVHQFAVEKCGRSPMSSRPPSCDIADHIAALQAQTEQDGKTIAAYHAGMKVWEDKYNAAISRAEAAERDAARLDWVASWPGDTGICAPGQHGGNKDGWLVHRDLWIYKGIEPKGEWEGLTLRDAIDAALAREAEGGERG